MQPNHAAFFMLSFFTFATIDYNEIHRAIVYVHMTGFQLCINTLALLLSYVKLSQSDARMCLKKPCAFLNINISILDNLFVGVC